MIKLWSGEHMWKQIPINPSRAVVFRRFDTICAIAKVMKGCHCYYLSAEDMRLYGANENYFNLHAIDLPADLVIPISMNFRLNTIDYGLLPIYKDFVLYLDHPWVMLPLATIDQHTSYTMAYVDEDIGWTVLDKDGYKVDHLNLYGVNTDNAITAQTVVQMVYRKKLIEPLLGEKQLFGDMEKSELIQTVMNTKASEGARYMSLTNMNGKRYGFMLFKNLFSLNKADQLTIIIRDRLDNPNLYEATFITSKKKSPIQDILPNYTEYVYTMFINI